MKGGRQSNQTNPDFIRVGQVLRRGPIACSSRTVSPLFFALVFALLPVFGSDDSVPLYRQSQLSELRSPLDSVNLATYPEPKGLRFGALKVDPYFTLDSTYSDNSRQAAVQRTEDVLLEYAGGFAAAFRPHECVKFTLNYEFGWHDYAKDTVKDYLTHRAGFGATLNRVFVEGMSLAFSDQYLQTAGGNILENEIVQFARYQSDRSSARAQYKYDCFKISGEYSYSFTDYFEREAFGKSNFRTHTGSLEAAWEWLPRRLEIFESFQIQRTLFDHAGISDFDADTWMAGVRGSYSKLNYSVAAGYASAVPIYVDGVKGNGSFSADLGYVPHRRLSFALAASRSFAAGVRTGDSLETNLTASMKMVLTPAGKLSLSYARNQSDRATGEQQISVAYSSVFDYKLSRNASLVARVTRYDRTSTILSNAFTVDEVRLGFKLAW